MIVLPETQLLINTMLTIFAIISILAALEDVIKAILDAMNRLRY